jgi:hypothetical protein
MTEVKIDIRGGEAVLKHKDNFLTLMRAFQNNAVMLVECIMKDTGEHVAAICTISPVDPDADMEAPDTEYDIAPFAVFLNTNPFETLIPPERSEVDDEIIH